MISLTKPCMEDLSTEEAISQIDEAADSLRKRTIDNAAIASLDVKALYPSILHLEASREVAEFVNNMQQYKVKDFNIREAQVYIASNLSEEEIKNKGITNLIPERKCKIWTKTRKYDYRTTKQ